MKDEEGDTRATVRLGSLLKPMVIRVTRGKKSCSILIRLAVKLYIADGRVPQIQEFINELRKAHADMPRIGGNQIRIAMFYVTLQVIERESTLRTVADEK